MNPNLFYTLGHGTLQADTFRTTLRAAGATVAADVRRFAGSRRHPQFGAAEMRGWLGEAAIEYRGMPISADGASRGGFTNVALRNTGFRGYADYMATGEFRAGFDALLALAGERTTAIFCAETLWWRCHRRLIADAAVLLAGFEVIHLTPSSRAGHVLTPGVRRAGNSLVYDVGTNAV